MTGKVSYEKRTDRKLASVMGQIKNVLYGRPKGTFNSSCMGITSIPWVCNAFLPKPPNRW